MEIFIAILKALVVVWAIIGVLAALFLIYIAVEDIWSRRVEERNRKNNKAIQEAAKRELRETKERVARESVFFDGDYYARGFFSDGTPIRRGRSISTEKSLGYYRQMDEMDVTQNMEAYTEES